MIFLQMVDGLRHYPVAAADAQTFPHPVILNETGVPAALTKPLQQGVAVDPHCEDFFRQDAERCDQNGRAPNHKPGNGKGVSS
jgi:hypothetical protein